jgi:predicted peptidase
MNREVHMADENCRMNYKIYYPDNYQNLPLMIYLHGAGERGIQIDHIDRHAIPKNLKEGCEYKAVILCPQCPAHLVWNNIVEDVKKLIDQVVERFEIQKDRICITGSSMGGFGTFEMGLTYSNFFSAIAPVAGGGLSWRASNLKSTPVRAYHGDADSTVPVVYSELMVNAVNQTGGSAELVTLKGFGHNDSIEYAYENTDLIEWLLSARRTDFAYVPEALERWF